MQVTETGSVRVDLLGGTLDLEPMNLVLGAAVTINLATQLEAKVTITSLNEKKVVFESIDYQSEESFSLNDINSSSIYTSTKFEQLHFLALITHMFQLESGIKITSSSDAPTGSGLGGSSAMGVVLHKALARLTNKNFSIHETVRRVKSCESIILNQGMPGYQDYYPALTGGVLALSGKLEGIQYEQLYSEEFKLFLEQHLSIVYSNISRDSGINNWQLYKDFFDRNPETKRRLEHISQLSTMALEAIKNKNYPELLRLIVKEGEARVHLAPNIVPQAIFDLAKKLPALGIKMCGAGGGGCFLVCHDPADKERVRQEVKAAGMRVLKFIIRAPYEQ